MSTADMHYDRLFSRILYGSIYVILFLVLLGLLLITPGDAIERSVSNGQRYNVLILIISYVTTVVIVIFVYFFRLYITKTAIAAIPKAWVPVDKGDVKDIVYRMISTGLNRNAIIAFEARPREDHRSDIHTNGRKEDDGKENTRPSANGKAKVVAEDLGLPLPPRHPVWGKIEHHGWASPNSADLPNLQYDSVLSELPNLIEALTLVPTEQGADVDPPMLDPDAAGLLQRVPNMTLRGYLEHLAELGVVSMDETTTQFLSQYEHARFSNRPISNAHFRELMHLFAEILRMMQPLDFNALTALDEEVSYGWGPSGSDIDNDAPLDTNPPSPGSIISRVESASSAQNSVRRQTMRTPSAHAWSFRTAPNTPGSRRTGMRSRRSSRSSRNSFSQTRRPYPASQRSNSSVNSKAGTSDSGSVIRLATREDNQDLPYVLNLNPTADS